MDEESVFFTVLGEIRLVSKSGGVATALAKADLIGYSRLPVAVDKTNLYYYEELGVPQGTRDKKLLLRKVSKDGGMPVTLYSSSRR